MIMERISDTVEFFPIKLSMLNISSTDSDIHAAQALIYALQNMSPESALVTLGNTQNEA